jgi:site-specific DNA-cytosine methylase
MLTYLAIAARYRPEWLVWENVPGVLSSGEGRDFGSLLGGLGELGYGFAYRILDAQYFGLAQRRQRVFVVGCLGGWRRAAAVLFERASLQGNPAPSRKAGKNTSHELSPSIGASGRGFSRAGETRGVANAILTPNGGRGGIGVGAVAFNARQDPDAWEERTGPIDTNGSTESIGFVQVSPTLRAGGNQTGGPPGTDVDTVETLVSQAMSVRRLTPRECERLQGFPTVIERVTITGCLDHQKTSVNVALQCRRLPSNAPHAEGDESSEYVSPADFRLQNDQESCESLVALHVRIGFAPKVVALRSQGKWRLSADNAANPKWSPLLTPQDSFAHAFVALWRGVAPVATDGKEGSPPSTLSFTLPVRGNWLAAMFGQENAGFASGVSGAQAEATTYITSNHGRDMRRFDWSDQTSRSFVLNAIASCIQEKTKAANSFSAVVDFETDYTAITRKGKPAADGPRYKALGNSMAVPVMAWIGRRIDQCSQSTSGADHVPK